MTEIDLIPGDYRRLRVMRRWLLRFALVYGVLVLVLGTARASLSLALRAEASAIEHLRADKASLLGEKAELDALRARRDALTGRLATLERLRGGPRLEQVFVAVDRALAREVWFVDWRFLRAGEYVPESKGAVRTGYFIVVPQPGDQSAGKGAWRLRTHMKIRAQATSHGVLAGFVERLARQPVFAEVKVLDTRVSPAASPPVVDFELGVVVREGGAAS